MMCKTAVHLLTFFSTISRRAFFTFPLVCLEEELPALVTPGAGLSEPTGGGWLLAQEAGPLQLRSHCHPRFQSHLVLVPTLVP